MKQDFHGFPRIGDLFFDIQEGIENELFLPSALPWQPLALLGNILNAICSTRSQSMQQYIKADPGSNELDFEAYMNSDDEYPKHKNFKHNMEPGTFMQTEIGVVSNDNHPFPYLHKVCDKIEPGAYVDERLSSMRGGWGLRCDATGRIQGPVFFGRGVQIRQTGMVQGSIVGNGKCPNFASGCRSWDSAMETGAGCIIGNGVAVRRSLIRSPGVKIESGTQVVDCIIGRGVYINSGAQIAHERFNGKSIVIPFMDEQGYERSFDTGLTKLGAVIGDGCYVGVNVTMHPGVILMPGCQVKGGTILKSGVYYPQSFFNR